MIDVNKAENKRFHRAALGNSRHKSISGGYVVINSQMQNKIQGFRFKPFSSKKACLAARRSPAIHACM
jgi:hypothetical protein